MRGRRTNPTSGPTHRSWADPDHSECSGAGRCSTLASTGSGSGIALPSLIALGVTCAGQGIHSGSALGDEDVHSSARTSPDLPPHPAEDGDALWAAGRPGEPGVCRGCAHGDGLPLPWLSAPVRRSDLFCAVTPMDRRGRLADRSPIRAAGWSLGEPITISISRDPRRVIVRSGGPDTITRDGHLRLPARIRHACNLSAGERLLVTVTATPPVVAVYPMATIETIIGQQPGEPVTIMGAP